MVRYPAGEFRTYAELLAFVRESVSRLEAFVVLGESFSSPLAVHLAATRPENLAGLIICAGFVSNPFPHTRFLVNALAKPFLFRLPAPDWVYKCFVTGASPALRQKVRQVTHRVAPQVLSGRVHEILNCDAREDLVRTSVPVMYLQGAYDRLIGRKCFEEIQKLQTSVRLTSIPSSHLVLQQKPREAADAILKFVQEIELEQAALHP